jgi:hypothetical protein
MRTTLDIDAAVLAAARTLAAERGISIGAALSELARRGLERRAPASLAGLPAFAVSDDASPITPQMVREANEEQ